MTSFLASGTPATFSLVLRSLLMTITAQYVPGMPVLVNDSSLAVIEIARAITCRDCRSKTPL
jgi:hypothetical protein